MYRTGFSHFVQFRINTILNSLHPTAAVLWREGRLCAVLQARRRRRGEEGPPIFDRRRLRTPAALHQTLRRHAQRLRELQGIITRY